MAVPGSLFYWGLLNLTSIRYDSVCSVAEVHPGCEALPVAERLRAGQTLGLLGDPRFPLIDEEWLARLANRSTRLTTEGEHYWRFVPAGSYWLGGWADLDPYAGPLQRDQRAA